MYLKIVAAVVGIFLLSCVVLPNLVSETDEGATQNPDQPTEQSETYKWLTETPEGQEVSRRADESGNPEQFLKDYARWRREGESHKEALQGWRGAPRRVVRDIAQIPSEFEKVRRDPFGDITQHYTGYVFTTWLFYGFYNVVRGNFDLTDIFGALFIPCVVTFVLTRRESLRPATAIIWFLDLIIDVNFWLYHLVATVIVAGLTVLVRWAIQCAKEASANK